MLTGNTINKFLLNVKLTDKRTSFPETFREELNYQCGRLITFASVITLSWLTYIPVDLQMHPDKPLIIVMRIGFPAVGLLIFLTRFIGFLRERKLLVLTFYTAYMAVSNAILTGSTNGDPAYIGGYIFILTLIAIPPIEKKAAYAILALSLACFFTMSISQGVDFSTPGLKYSFNDIICIPFIIVCIIHILNSTRYLSWYKSRQVEVGEQILKIQKMYSDSLEETVQKRTSELQVERNNLKIRNEIMENDLKMAKQIHEKLLPVNNPSEFISSLYKPMDLVGGDFFDFIKFRDSGKTGIFLSDVSGHGLAAAFITSMIKTIILQAGEKKLDPAELLKYINDILNDQIGGNFVTAFYGIYDSETRKFLFSNAGHNPPFIITDRGISLLQGNKTMPLAVMKNSFLIKNKEYKNAEVTLPAGSKVLLYTDGFTECRPSNRRNITFEDNNINGLFKENLHHPCGVFINNLYLKLIDFRGNELFEDDVCLICLDVR